MQAIILAAGLGSRLGAYTQSEPKAMVKVGGVPLLERCLSVLEQSGISNVIVVVGYQKEKITTHIGCRFGNINVKYVENTEYTKSNNIYSLYITKDEVDDDVLLIECDLLFCPETLMEILSSSHHCNILVSPYNEVTMNGTVIKAHKNGRVEQLILGRAQGSDFDYSDKLKTVNIYRFQAGFFHNHLIPMIDLFIKMYGRNSFYEVAIGALAYFGLSEIFVNIIDERLWYEIDDENDLALAQRGIEAWQQHQ